MSTQPHPLTMRAIRIASLLLPRPIRRGIKRFYATPPMTDFGESLLGGQKLAHLTQTLDDVLGRNVPGDLMECGVYRGGSAIAIASILRQRQSAKKLTAVDLFDDFQLDSVFSESDRQNPYLQRWVSKIFTLSLYDEVLAAISAQGLDPWVMVHKGAFADVFPSLPESQYCFAHVDCDFYTSVRDCILYLRDRMAHGGVILFDDYGDDIDWPGVKKAVHELLGPDSVTALPSGQAYWISVAC